MTNQILTVFRLLVWSSESNGPSKSTCVLQNAGAVFIWIPRVQGCHQYFEHTFIQDPTSGAIFAIPFYQLPAANGMSNKLYMPRSGLNPGMFYVGVIAYAHRERCAYAIGECLSVIGTQVVLLRSNITAQLWLHALLHRR